MACHYIEIGPTSLVVGAVYCSGNSWDRHRYELKSINEATGIARLERLTGAFWSEIFMSANELSHWVMVR